MTLDLSKIEFVSDFFSVSMPDGSTLILNKISEDFIAGDKNMVVKQINIIVSPFNSEESIICSSVIGTENDYFKLVSGYAEYLGQILDEDTMKYCTIEIKEEE